MTDPFEGYPETTPATRVITAKSPTKRIEPKPVKLASIRFAFPCKERPKTDLGSPGVRLVLLPFTAWRLSEWICRTCSPVPLVMQASRLHDIGGLAMV